MLPWQYAILTERVYRESFNLRTSNTYNKFIISHTHHVQYNTNQNTGASLYYTVYGVYD